MAATGHGGLQMRYLARPVSKYHAAYQRAVHVGFNDQVSAEPTKATGQTEPDDSSDVDVPAIAAGVTVSVVLLIIAGVALYIWYRKKFPVRMIIGKDFGKFTNPAYSRKSSTATLTRQDSFEKEIQKMSAEKCVSHDNHVDLSDEQEYQPTSGLTMLGSIGLREGLDDLDSPEMKKRFYTKQRKKVVPGPKVVIEEEEEGEKGKVTNISDSSSDTSDTSSTEEKNSASDENSDGEGFRPVTDAPKIKRKRISTYLNEVLDRQNSHDSSYVDEQDGPGISSDTGVVPGSVDVVVHAEKQQMTDKEMPDNDEQSNNEELVEVRVSSDVPSANDAVEQNEIDENAKGVSKPDRPLLKLGIQGLNFTDDVDDNEGSQSSTSTDEDNKTEESMKTQNDLIVENGKETNFTTAEIMTEVNNLLQQETKSSFESIGKSEPINESGQVEHIVVLPDVTEVDDVEGEHETFSVPEESNALTCGKFSDEKEMLIVGIPDVSEISAVLTDIANETEASSKQDAAEVSSVPSLLDEIQLEGVNLTNDTYRGATYGQMSDMQPESAAVDIATERISEEPEELAHKKEDHTVPNQDIVGYLTRDEMRELTARTKSFGEDSLSSVYSGEIVEEDLPVAEIAEQDYFSSGLSLDETDSLEIPYKNKAEVQFERLIQDIEKHSNSSDVEEGGEVTENADQEDETTKTEQSVISFDSSPFDSIPNECNGETSDFLPLVDHSKSNNSQTLTIAPSSDERFANSSTKQPFIDFSSFEEKNISIDKSSSAQPTSLLMSGFDMGESSTDVQNQLNVLKIPPDEHLLNASSAEDDSDDSKESNEDLMEYVVNPDVNGEGIADDEEDDDQIDELQLTTESGGKGRRTSVTLENPSFDTLDFSKFQQNTSDAKLDDNDKESDVEARMKPTALGRRESVSLDNPFYDTNDQVLPEPQQKGEKLRVIQVSNLLVTPPTSSSESSSEDTESETGSGGEYQVNPSSDREDEDLKTTSKFEKELQYPDLPEGVVNFLSFDSESERANATESKPTLTSLLGIDPRESTKLEPVESDVSSLDSATLKEIEDISSDSEASNKGHGLASSTASASAPKKFSLSSISRKFKSSFKTTAKPDLKTGDNDIVDV
ncbi:uncharacterized protein LOC110457601 [Mizuhopecten yessoensis]|nr:uncharacterized protein LOC110457601 [Mizuhopecten yessoensis]